MAFTRRELMKFLGRGMLMYPVVSSILATSCGGGNSASSGAPAKSGLTDEQLLDQIQQASFQFFWNEAADTGMVKDRAHADGGDSYAVSSIASTGFGLTALCIADSRGYLPHQQIRDRIVTTLNFLQNVQAMGQGGFLYHFVDMNSGQRAFNSEVSSIDTAILMCGILTAKQYFNDPTISQLSDQLYQSVDWQWMLNGGQTFSMGYMPESGFLSSRWDTYSELMMIYLLAIGSPTYAVAPSTWDAFVRPAYQYQGLQYINNTAAPLFIHQYSHAWFDFRNTRDAYANYFDNSVTATRAHKAFCLSLAGQYPDYTDSLWGITSSDSPNGYVAWGGPPQMGPIDGTIVPCAAGGSISFLPADCLRVLHSIRERYPNAWRKYGFVDAFNPLSGWYNADVIGIDIGITMLMAENYRTGLVWQTFMKNPEASDAMNKVGFSSPS